MRPVTMKIGISILDKHRADVHHAEVAGTDFRGHVEIENHLAFGLIQNAIEEPPKVTFRSLAGGFDTVDFEIVDAIRAMQLQQARGVALPIGEVVARIRREPQTEAHALARGLAYERIESSRKTRGVRNPKIGIERPEAVPGAAAPASRVCGAAMLPAVVDLNHIDAQAGAGFHFLGHEISVDAQVARAVAPSVAEEHGVAPRIVRPYLTLKGLERFDAPYASAVVSEQYITVAGAARGLDTMSGKRAAHALPAPRRLGVISIRNWARVGQRGFFQKHESAAFQSVFEEKQVALDTHGPLVRMQQPLVLEDEFIVHVGLIEQRDLREAGVRHVQVEILQRIRQ